MKKSKIKQVNYQSEDAKEIKNLIIIMIIIIVIALGLYFFTDFIMKKEDTNKAEFNYDECLIGTMFNRPYDEYYVFAYSSDNEKANDYNTLKLNYEKKDDALKIYYVDMSTNWNNVYLSETSNANPTKPSEVKIKSSALFHIKNGKVSAYYETTEDYEKVLK